MFAEQRMEIIKQVIRKNKQVNISELCSMLNVSDVTVRKYLDILERQHVLVKVHGGAILAEQSSANPAVYEKDNNRYSSIAELAVTLINERESIYISPGEAGVQLAKKIKRIQGLSVITNNYNAVADLNQKVESLHLIGGNIGVIGDSYYFTYVPDTDKFMDNLAVGQAFIGVDGFDLNAGFTIGSLEASVMIHKCLKISGKVNILLHSSAFPKISLHRVCELDDVDTIIADADIADDLKELCYARDIKLFLTYNDL